MITDTELKKILKKEIVIDGEESFTKQIRKRIFESNAMDQGLTSIAWIMALTITTLLLMNMGSLFPEITNSAIFDAIFEGQISFKYLGGFVCILIGCYITTMLVRE